MVVCLAGLYITSASHLGICICTSFLMFSESDRFVQWLERTEEKPLARRVCGEVGDSWPIQFSLFGAPLPPWASQQLSNLLRSYCDGKNLLQWKNTPQTWQIFLRKVKLKLMYSHNFTLDKLAFSSEKNALLRNSGAALLSSPCAKSPSNFVPVLNWAFVHRGWMYQRREKQSSNKHCQNTLT